MTEAEKQKNALDVLKSLNAAVTTTKLYPPSFPQVANAVELAYEQLRSFLRKHGELSFSLLDNEPNLCGHPVSQKTLGKTHGEDIFQQLRLLQIVHVRYRCQVVIIFVPIEKFGFRFRAVEKRSDV